MDDADKNLLCYTEKTRDGHWVSELLQENEYQELITASLNFFNMEKVKHHEIKKKNMEVKDARMLKLQA